MVFLLYKQHLVNVEDLKCLWPHMHGNETNRHFCMSGKLGL